jgi:LysR family transcriptional activator of nhaA
VNFKHLYYFWVTARAGGIMRAGEQLHTTPQTLSGQIKLLEGWLGCRLFQKSGRNLDLTEHGRVALGYADQIFSLGSALESSLRQTGSSQPRLLFRVGISDAVSKSLAYKLLEPALGMSEPVKLVASEGKFMDLLAQLALHRLDLVIADEPMPKRVSVKAYNHLLGRCGVSFFAAPALQARLQGLFPACLDGQPLLVPGSSAAIRVQLDDWLTRARITPDVVGEFDDAALMKAFGREGQGVFMAPSVLEQEVCAQYGVGVVGRSSELVQEFYAVSVERLTSHPCMLAMRDAAHEQLFGA